MSIFLSYPAYSPFYCFISLLSSELSLIQLAVEDVTSSTTYSQSTIIPNDPSVWTYLLITVNPGGQVILRNIPPLVYIYKNQKLSFN